MTRPYEIVTADARQVSAADFLKAFAPKRSRVEELCAELWNASPERVREIHEELATEREQILEATTVRPIGDGWHRAEAA